MTKIMRHTDTQIAQDSVLNGRLKIAEQNADKNVKLIKKLVPWAIVKKEAIVHKEKVSERRNRKFTLICKNCNHSISTYLYDIKTSNKICKKCEYIPILNELHNKWKGRIFEAIPFQKEGGIKTRDGFKIQCSCECGNIIRTEYKSYYTKKGISLRCLKCKPYLHNMTEDVFFKMFKNDEGLIFSSSTFNNQNNRGKKIRTSFKCSHGHLNDISLGQFFFKEGLKCGQCSKRTSNAELKTIKFLKQKNIKFETQYYFENLRSDLGRALSFDIYTDNFCVELDGQQHFHFVKMFHKKHEGFIRQLINDEIKDQYCEDNNIKLIRVPYYYAENNLEEYLEYRLQNMDIKNNYGFRKRVLQGNIKTFYNISNKSRSNSYIMFSVEEAENILLSIDINSTTDEILLKLGRNGKKFSQSIFMDLIRGQNRFDFLKSNIIRKKVLKKFFSNRLDPIKHMKKIKDEKFIAKAISVLGKSGLHGGYLNRKECAIKLNVSPNTICNIMKTNGMFDHIPEILEIKKIRKNKKLSENYLSTFYKVKKLILLQIDGKFLKYFTIMKVAQTNMEIVREIVKKLKSQWTSEDLKLFKSRRLKGNLIKHEVFVQQDLRRYIEFKGEK